VVADVAGGSAENQPLLGGREGGRGEVRHGGLLAAQVPSVGEEVKENATHVVIYRSFADHDVITKLQDCEKEGRR
jgi:hypothetical protein